MKKLITSIFALLVTLSFTNAQTVNWAQKIGGVKSDKATTIKTDSLGYIYVTGYFSTQISLGTNGLILPFQSNAQSKEAFVAKFDSLGFCYWAKAGGGYFDDRILGLGIDAAGNTIGCGTYWSSGINFGANYITTSYGGGDQCFIVKHDPNGNFLWGATVTSDGGDDQGTDIVTDKWGNHYIVGFMSGNNVRINGNAAYSASNLNPSGSFVYDNTYWIAKINGAGTPQWIRTYGRQPLDSLHYKYVERDLGVCVDDSGGVYVCGGFDYNPKFTSTISKQSKGGHDIFVMKFDSSGTAQWVETGGSDQDDWANGIAYDQMGHIYVTGEHRDSLLFDTLIIKNYNKRDIFVMKLDAKTGKPLWGHRAGTSLGAERGNDVFADKNCNVYVCGDVQAGGKFGDNLQVPPNNSVQSFVAKISPEGKWLWVVTGGGTDSNDRCNSIVKGNYGQLYACGFFRTPATFGSNPPLTSNGNSDAFIMRLNDDVVNQSSNFKFTKPNDTVVCPGGSVYLAIPKHDYFNYSGATDISPNLDTSIITISPTQTTTYTLTGSEGIYCTSFDTLIFTVTVAPLPQVSFTVSPDITVLKDSVQLNLTNTTTGAITYQWINKTTNLQFATSTDASQKIYFPDFGEKCFKLIAVSNEGCVDSNEGCSTLISPSSIYMPNAFSPNNDGKNETFGPFFYYTDLNKITDFQMIIADRQGKIVFTSNSAANRWNGTYAEKYDAEMGTYFYICRFKNLIGEFKEYKGDLMLVR
jgi:gliding motility-associated-like protein